MDSEELTMTFMARDVVSEVMARIGSAGVGLMGQMKAVGASIASAFAPAPAAMGLEEQIAAVKAELASLAAQKVQIGIQSDQFRQEIKLDMLALNELKAMAEQGVNVTVRKAEVLTDIQEIRTNLVALDGQRTQIKIDTASARTQLAALETQEKAVAASAVGTGGAMTGLKTKVKEVEQAVGDTTRVMGGFGNSMGRLMNLLAGGGPLMLALAALVGGGLLFAGLDNLATKTGEYSLKVVENSNVLKINTDLLQTLYHAGDLVGLSQAQLTTSLMRLTANLDNGASQLKKMGYTLADLGITTNQTQAAFLQLADHFKAMGDSSEATAQKVGILRDVFGMRGGGGGGLLAILNMGSDGIAGLTKEFSQFGLVLNAGQLAIDSTGRLMQERFGLVMQGLEMTIGNALIPAFMMLWDVLGKILAPMDQAGSTADRLAHALSMAVVWVAALVAALTGTKIALSDFTSSTTPFIDSLTAAGGTADQTAAAMDSLSGSVGGTTTALQDQIQTVQDQQAAVDDAAQAQVDAQNVLKDAYDTAADAQLHSLDIQRQALDLARQQQQMNQALATDQADIAATQQEIAAAPFTGVTNVGSLYATLADQQKKLAKDTEQAQYDAKVNDLNTAKATITDQKKAYDDMIADKINGISLAKKAQDDAFKDEVKNLQEQLKEAQKTAAGTLASGLAATTGLQAGYDGLNSKITDSNTSTSNLADGFAQMSASGTAAAGSLKDAMKSLTDTVHSAQQAVEVFVIVFSVLSVAVNIVVLLARAVADLAKIVWDLVANVSAVPADFKTLEKDFVGFVNDSENKATAVTQALAAINNTATAGPSAGGGTQPASSVPPGFSPVMLASGGIITRPTLAVVGDNPRGEAVIPLDRLPSVSGQDQGLLQKLLAVNERMASYLNSIANDNPSSGGFAAAQQAG